jgi:alpha-galactosidase
LQPLIEHVNKLGMEFGLWVEPEMVNPNSDLYRAHPDWVIHYPTRQRTEARNQLVLNLARQDVQDYLIGQLDKLLTENNITFIKWDMNRTVSEPGWPAYEGDQREIWVRYVQGVYRLWETLRQRHPHVIWQSCSGGGGRADMGILRYADQIWVSDNTGGTSRLAIQEGFSQVFPANTMEAWVTDTEPNLSLTFKLHVSMCGSLGIGANITHWNDAERAEAKKWIAVYKDIRSIIQLGDQYRLRSAQTGGFSAVQYVSKDKSEGVVFAFRTHIPDPVNPFAVRLRGLNPQALYAVEGFENVKSGAAWMHTDTIFRLTNFESTLRRIKRVKSAN